ncbi:hypothetical protein ACQEU8_02440 [Streptomyces sp. CA-250714]|uniref:hypothetical protein n=1 Tax=Streptomyces sp. CA-250714 TaxID=3240060 RepID=UPI003D8CEC81
MSPEMVTALGGFGVALVSSGPAYIAIRRARRASDTAEGEGAQTREAIDSAVSRLAGRLDELRTDVREVREWQTSHTAHHILIDHNLNPGDES